MTSEAINQLFEDFKKLKILIVGDTMLDSYIWGKVERISPEAPVPVVAVRKRESRLGGAGNVVLNIAALGATPILCSVLGQDSAANLVIEALEKSHLQTDGLIFSENRPTTVKERIMASSQQMLRIDTETDLDISETEQEALLQKINTLLPEIDVVLFQDYDKGVLTPNLIKKIIDLANTKNIPTIVDPKKRNFLAYQNVTLFKPNLKELKEGLKVEFDVSNKVDLEANVALLKQKTGAKGIFVTLSEQGTYINLDSQKHHILAHIRNIADVSGAGDTVVSIAACCLALGASPHTIAALSNLGGGLVCESVGVVPVEVEKLREEFLKMNNA